MSKIIGQDKLIKEVNRIFQVFVNSNCKIRPHFILTGESGSGKSFTIKQLCDMNELNFLEVNAAQITKEGISGNSLSKILSPLVNYSHTPIVVFVDEFDKLFINGNTNSQLANESTASVQNEFLKLLESDTTSVFGDYGKYISVPIDNVLFVFAGAFNNEPHITLDRLRDFGVKTEFLGRVGLIYNTKPLTLEDLYSILECSDLLHYGYLVFKKERNLETGRIESFEIEESKNCYYSTFVFIDDLCDAGGTFLGELKVLKERYPNSKFIIIVCHAVNNKGLINMCNNFDQVIVSNSHRDINYRPSNENLTVIDVCK